MSFASNALTTSGDYTGERFKSSTQALVPQMPIWRALNALTSVKMYRLYGARQHAVHRAANWPFAQLAPIPQRTVGFSNPL
jgi:hypothetical protein